MIGSVRGSVLERAPSGEVLVEVGGVGYRVLVPLGTVAVLQPGGKAFLFTHLHARDDAMVLYGFTTREERDTFELLIATTGVGPKLALAILSVHPPVALQRAVADDDVEALVAVPGVGKRTAQRLLVELKSRLDIPDVDLARHDPTPDGSRARAEVRAGLVTLGYEPGEIRSVLADVDDDGTVEEQLRAALRRISARAVR